MKKLFLFINMNNIIFYSNYCENSNYWENKLGRSPYQNNNFSLYFYSVKSYT